MVGSIVFELALLPGPWWDWRLAEVVILPLQYLLFFVSVSVATGPSRPYCEGRAKLG